MAIDSTPIDIHWNYFLSIEEDLLRLSRFIEFHEDNYTCFSLEAARILLAAASEVDVVCKQICRRLDPNSKADSITQYRNPLLQEYKGLSGHKIEIPRFGMTLRPWDNWNNSERPEWWAAYNNVKHHRNAHYHDANLKNVINAVAGLCVVCLHLYEDEQSFNEKYNVGRTKKLRPNTSILTPPSGVHSSNVLDGRPYKLYRKSPR